MASDDIVTPATVVHGRGGELSPLVPVLHQHSAANLPLLSTHAIPTSQLFPIPSWAPRSGRTVDYWRWSTSGHREVNPPRLRRGNSRSLGSGFGHSHPAVQLVHGGTARQRRQPTESLYQRPQGSSSRVPRLPPQLSTSGPPEPPQRPDCECPRGIECAIRRRLPLPPSPCWGSIPSQTAAAAPGGTRWMDNPAK